MKIRRFFFAFAAFTGFSSAATFTWTSGTTADWNSNNWGGSFPNAAGDIAQYTDTAANATTTLNVNATVGEILGNNPGRLWTISPAGGALTLDNTGGAANAFANNHAAIAASGGAADSETLRVAAPIQLANTDLDIGMANGGLSITGPITANTNQVLTLRNNATVTNRHVVISGSIGTSGAGMIALSNAGTRITDSPSGSNASGVLLSGTIGSQVTGITHNSPGGLFLTGFNTFTGPISVGSSTTPGLLGIASNTALGDPANDITLNNGVLSNILINSTTSNYTSGTNLHLGAGHDITLGAGGGKIRNAYAKYISINGIIGGTGPLERTDAGVIVFNGLNTYTGVTTLGSGTTRVSVIGNGGEPGNLGAASSAAANLVFNTGNILQYTGATASTDRNFTFAAGVVATFDVLKSGSNLTLSGGAPATTAALTKNGAGLLTLAGTNAYTGTTTVNFGTLGVTGSLTSNLLIGGAILTGSGTTTGNITFNNVSGVGVLASPQGTTALQGANLVLNGVTNVYTSQLGDFTTATGAGPVNVLRYTGTQTGAGSFSPQTNHRNGLLTNTGGAVTLEYKAEAKTWAAAADGIWDVNTSSPWTGTADSLFFWGDAVTFGDTAADQTVTLTGNLVPSAIAVTNTANTYTFAGTGPLVGTAALTKSGMGTLALNNTTANTFLGGLVISAGTVTTNQPNGQALGYGTITLGDANTADNPTSLLAVPATATQTISKNIIVSSQGTGIATLGTGPAAADSLSFTSLFLNRATTLRNGATTGNRVNFRNITGNVGTLTIAAPTTAGNRVVFDAVDNTFTGDLLVAAGASLQLGVASVPVDSIPDPSNVTVNGTMNLSFSSVGETINALNGTGSIGTNSSTNNTLTIGAANGTGSFSGQLTQGGTGGPALAIRKVGTGTQTFTGPSTGNNYSGGTIVDGGTLILSKTAGFGGQNGSIGSDLVTINAGATVTTTTAFAIDGRSTASTRVINLNGGTLNLAGSEYIRTYNLTGATLNAPTATNDFLRSSSAGLSLNSLASPVKSTINNKIDLTFADLVVDTADGAALTDLEFTGALTQNSGAGTGAKALTKNGAGTLLISGPYSYTGNTTVGAGTLALKTATLADSSTVNIANGAVLKLDHLLQDTVSLLFINGVQQASGTWGASGSGATHIDNAHFSGTGRLNVSTPPPSNAYPLWAAGQPFTPGVDDAKGDNPDGDAFNNFGEFAFNGDPLDPKPSGKIVAKVVDISGEKVLTLTLPVRNGTSFNVVSATAMISSPNDGVIYRIEGSDSLNAFDLVISEISPITDGVVEASPGWTLRTFRTAGTMTTTPKQFIRAKVIEP